MALCKLTLASSEDDVPVYVNPLQVFAARWSDAEGVTFIFGPAVEADGTKMTIRVKEDSAP